MSEEVKTKKYLSISSKSVSAFVIFFCFILFPLFFIHSSLTLYFSNEIENLKEARINEMNHKLEYMEKYSSNNKYFHFLLSQVVKYASEAKDPISYLKASLNNLKEKYPNSFEFVVWQKNGDLVKELTDKKGYNYVLTKLYSSLLEVSKEVEKSSTVRIASIESIKNNKKIFQNLLGRVFVPENLKIPLLNSVAAGPFITEIGYDLSQVWFSVNNEFGLFAFISKKLLEDYTGLRKITEVMNKTDQDIISGFSVYPQYLSPQTPFPENHESSLNMALLRLEDLGDSVYDSEKALVKMAMPQAAVRTFCYLPKSEEWNYDYKLKLWFWILTSALLGIYSIMVFWYLYKNHFFSIRWKITALFLFANLSPLCILGFVAKEHIENKKISLRNELSTSLEKKLRDFDSNFKNQQEEYSLALNKLFDNLEETQKGKTFSIDSQRIFDNLFKDYSCTELYLVASSGAVLKELKDEERKAQSSDFVFAFCRSVLDYSNNTYNFFQTDLYSALLDPTISEVTRNSIKNVRNIVEISVGEFSRFYYSFLIPSENESKINYFFMMTWEKSAFLEIYIKDYFSTLTSTTPKTAFYFATADGKKTYCTQNLNWLLLDTQLKKNSGIADKYRGSLDYQGKKYSLVSINGKTLKNWSLLALYPEEEINKEIELLFAQIIAGAFLSLLLTMLIGHILSLQFLTPIKNLGKAAIAIDQRNFAHRIPIGDKDEFGHLNLVFNRAIEGLGDFEVARIIQESLFPGNRFHVGEYNIFGKSVVMTTLGGDYYDCFKIDEDHQGIIIGDVAGHGIPAGLMMAMAKSGVLTATNETKLDAAVLTARLHKIFFGIKNDKLKRMMTFQYYVLNTKEHKFCYTNAGHCFPVLVDPINKTAKFLDYIATPLGIGPKCRCKNQEFSLEKGQTLMLYTDGIVEAADSKGEQYGYDRFKESLIQHYDPNPEVFYYNLYNKVYKQWSPKPDDDLTLLIVNRN